MSSKKKELTLQETFYNLCKDLIRYIDKKIVRKYILPNQAQIPKEKRNKEIHFIDNKWRYFYEDEETTETEKIKDIFKDNNFLSNLQNLYNDLNIITTNLEQNKNDNENLDKKIQMENEQMKLVGDINMQLAKYLMENGKNLNSINKDDLIKVFEELKKNNSIDNLNPEIIQFYINNLTKTQNIKENNDIQKKEEKEIKNNIEIKNNENINNESIKKENKINNQNNNNKTEKRNVITKLFQAFDILKKNKNQKNKEEQKDELIKNIFESDSNDSNNNDDDNEEEEEEDDDEEEEENDNTNNKIINDNNNKNNNDGITNNFLNKKVKRNNE